MLLISDACMKVTLGTRLTSLSSAAWTDYELLDSGAQRKLERFGPYRFIRPEPQAVWMPLLPEKHWKDVDAVFQTSAQQSRGRWKFLRPMKPRWIMQYKNLKFWVHPTPSRHMGVFPEQASHWDWIVGLLDGAYRPVKILSLF